ncbi:Rad17 cell cycle checkpoint protein-domain-containing protein [Cytidiella melzeri]|nr:Rad17 cell cycle checkpoint protein-domain-containing protein [Cytidiella melzeri]
MKATLTLSGSLKKRPASPPNSRKSILKLDSGPPPAKKQRLKPLNAFLQPPVFDLTGSQSTPSQASQATPNAKTKARVPKFEVEEDGENDGALWVDTHEPATEAELAVHVRKVKDVRQWLLEALNGGPSGKLRKYRRILVLTGPAGAAKTATMRVLSRELGFDIMEWRNMADERFYGTEEHDDRGDGIEYEGLSDKFHAFLSRAANSNSIFASTSISKTSARPHELSQHPSSLPSQRSTTKYQSRRVVLLEDLPNILHPPTQAAFQSSLQSLVVGGSTSSPVVIIISDAGVRGESSVDGISAPQTWKGKAREVIDVRTVLPPSLLNSPYVTQISFNPIAPTLMKRALQRLLTAHFSSFGRKVEKGKQPSKEAVDLIIESSNGDIRSAIMALQFACTTSPGDRSSASASKGRSKKSEKVTGSSRALLEAISRREQNLLLFHLLGKVLYNKRKGDAPSSSAAARDIQREKEIDMRLKDPPKLPVYLSEHDRRASRVDVETLYSDSPIDASLLSLYIQQNYTQYCDTLDECDGVIDWLSWVDSSGGESWQQANPHQFHLVTLGTLHSLPSPVPRRGQRPYKPEFFDNLKFTREGVDGLRDVQDWLRRRESPGASWTQREIAVEMGGLLKASDVSGSKVFKPPPTHQRFSRLVFTRGMTNVTDILDDKDVVPNTTGEDEIDCEESRVDPEKAPGGWLESDDIEDF